MSTETKPAEWMAKAAEAVVQKFFMGTKHPEELAAIIQKHAPTLEREVVEALRDCVEAECNHSTEHDTRRARRAAHINARAILARYDAK